MSMYSIPTLAWLYSGIFAWCVHLYFVIDYTTVDRLLKDRRSSMRQVCIAVRHHYRHRVKYAKSSRTSMYAYRVAILCASFGLLSFIIRSFTSDT